MKKTLIAIVLALSVAACGSLTPQDRADLTTYTAQENACIAAHAPDKAAIDACRAQVKAAYCARWNARMDGGVCQ